MRKILWIALGIVLVIGMLLVSCKTPETTTQPTQTITGKTTPQPTSGITPITEAPKPVAPSVETPKYGGITTIARETDILGFDEAFTQHYLVDTLHLTNEELLSHDWTRGPAGTGEANFQLGGVNRLDLKTGTLAESWEIPEKGTMIFHIRKGVYWHNKAPVNGRELVAADIVYSLNRLMTEARSYIKVSYPAMCAATTVTAPDKYTVVITTSLAEFGNMTTMLPDFACIVPKEMIDKYGDMRDWKNSCGTGPFMLTDFVAGSSATLSKNPNYWGKDPVGPGKGNQLPYLDGVRHLVIPDMATRYAALRTAKADWCAVTWEEAANFRKTNPELKWTKFIHDTTYVVFMRTDKADSPFSNLKVRQALTLGVDYKTLKDVFYAGDAEILCWPIVSCKEYANAYVPMDKLPAEVQELYSYNPEKAKKLLSEAGYPTGFKCSVICYNTPTQVDVMSQLKAMWAKIGVELTIDAKDYAVWTAALGKRDYTDMLYGYESGIGTFFKMINFNGPSQFNGSYVNDPKVQAAYLEMQKYVATDEKKMDEINRELMPYVLSQCWVITKTQPYTYYFWQPWLKNYYGGGTTGYYDYYGAPKYEWLDLEMRKQMIGK
jgi:peptide/nickel transport system substrate-binding protein